MQNPFVWFDNRSENTEASIKFYRELFGWNSQGGPGMEFLIKDAGPFAGVFEAPTDIKGWLPYLQVEDLEVEESKALSLGGNIVQERTKGPAGEYTIIKDPGGANFALWKSGMENAE